MSGTGASSSGSLNPGALASHLNFPGLDRINIRKRLALQDQQENDPDEVVYMDEEGISLSATTMPPPNIALAGNTNVEQNRTD